MGVLLQEQDTSRRQSLTVVPTFQTNEFGHTILETILLIGFSLAQVKKVVGFTAPPDFIEEVKALASGHSQLLCVDCLRAYHFGVRQLLAHQNCDW